MGGLRGPGELADQDGLDQVEGLRRRHDLGHRHGRLPRHLRQKERPYSDSSREHEGLHGAQATVQYYAKGK